MNIDYTKFKYAPVIVNKETHERFIIEDMLSETIDDANRKGNLFNKAGIDNENDGLYIINYYESVIVDINDLNTEKYESVMGGIRVIKGVKND